MTADIISVSQWFLQQERQELVHEPLGVVRVHPVARARHVRELGRREVTSDGGVRVPGNVAGLFTADELGGFFEGGPEMGRGDQQQVALETPRQRRHVRLPPKNDKFKVGYVKIHTYKLLRWGWNAS